MRSFASIVRELRHRRVFRTAGIYIVGAWVALQVAAIAFDSFGIPSSALRYVWLAAAVGLPIALVFGWRYDVTVDGIRRTPAATGTEELGLRRPDYLVLAALAAIALIAVFGVLNEIRLEPSRATGPWYATDRLATAIAVLPLENLSGDDSQNFLSAGLHDALITTLSRITSFRVTSRYSTRRVEAGAPLSQIREALGVDKVLSGSVTREGDLVRVNVTLLDTGTEQPLWADSFTREFSGMIDVQNEIASTVAREIKLTLTPVEQQQLTQASTTDSATYEAYLKGMMQLRRETPQGYRRGIEILTQAVEDAPTNALAYAGLAMAYAKLGHNPFPTKGASLRARDAAERALDFDPLLAEAHLAMGMVKAYYDWDFAGAEQSYLRALGLSPSLVDAHYHYAWLLELLHRDEEALRYGEYTKALNPLSAFYSAWLAYQYLDAGDYERAIAESEETLALSPGYQVAWLILGFAYADLGRGDEAIAAHEHLRDSGFWGWAPMMTLAATGRIDDAAEIGARVTDGTSNAFTLTLTYCAMNARAECLASLETAHEERHPWFPWLVAWFEVTRLIADEPQVRAYAEELGLEVSGDG